MKTDHARTYLTALREDLTRRTGDDPALAPFLRSLSDITPGPDRAAGPACTAPLFRKSLDAALAAMPPCGPVGEAAREMANSLGWYRVYGGAGVDPRLSERMFAGQVIGQVGLLDSATVRTGLFLLAPGLDYPMHTHAASEIYFCLSGSVTLQHGLSGTRFALGPGDISVTPSNRVHSLTTGAQPALLVYHWIGAVDAPNWWWRRGVDGLWWREKWVRQADASWAAQGSEPVPQDQIDAMS